ncbi:MAG: hypothetical protein ACRD2O_12255, partial [Terriglobia bacterium]
MKQKSLVFILMASALSLSSYAPAWGQGATPGGISAAEWARYQDEAVTLLQQYIQIDTSNPPGNEIQTADFFHHLFDAEKIPNKV